MGSPIYLYSPSENASVLSREPDTLESPKKFFQKTVVGDGLYAVAKVLREIKGVEQYEDPFYYWDVHFDFNVDTLEREGLAAIPYISVIEENAKTNINDNSLVVHRNGDILKQVTIKGKGITGYTVTVGGSHEILKEKVNNCDKLDITFGKIGFILLRVQYNELRIKMDADTIDNVDFDFVYLPTNPRRIIALKKELIDDSIPGTLVYRDGMASISEIHKK